MANQEISFDARQYSYPGGVARYVGSVLEEYKKNFGDYNLTLVGKEGELSQHFGDSFAFRELGTRLFSPWEQVSLLSRIRDSSLHHSPNFNAPLFYSGKLVVTIHDLTLVKFQDLTSNIFKRRYIKALMRKSVKRADRIIAVSENTNQDLRDIFDVPEDKISVIYNGLDERFRRMKGKKLDRALKEELDLNSGYILSLGNLKTHKNLPRLIQAVARAKLDEYKLVITGKGRVQSDLEGLVEEEGLTDSIRFTGYVTDKNLPLLYNGARLFVYPSLYEGFGFPPLEAMACGTPVVSSNAASLPEVTGNAAYLVEPYNVVEIAEAIAKVWGSEDLRERLIERGLRRVKRFSWKRCAKETLAVYSELLKG